MNGSGSDAAVETNAAIEIVWRMEAPRLVAGLMRLGRTLTTLIPAEAEVHGLVALMELQASRFGARLGPKGEAILLLEQDRNRWDRLLITRGGATRAWSTSRARRSSA